MAILYNNGKYDITRHSYSAGEDFRKCKKFYFLKKVEGWKEVKQNAALAFGNAIEAAIQHYHTKGEKPGYAVDEFKQKWLTEQKNTQLVYSEKTEGSWEDLYQAGSEMAALYEAKWRSFGYVAPKFQVSYRKEVFPGTKLAGLEFTAYLDMVALKKGVELPDGPINIDMKTSSVALDDTEGILQLDPQLRSQAWVSGISDNAFLWMQKFKVRPYKKGDRVTVIPVCAEETVVVANQKEQTVTTINSDKYKALQEGLDGLKDKEKDKLIANFAKEYGRTVGVSSVTLQRITFHPVHIPLEDQQEQGEIIGQEIADIHATSLKGIWPKEPLVRFPGKCGFCPMLGICLKNDKLRDEKVANSRNQTGSQTSKVQEAWDF